jgi:dynein intermediate chain 1
MDLSEADLGEEIPKVLTSENKNAPQNLVIFSFRDGGFVQLPKEGNVVTLFEFEGTALHIESAEAKAQLARDLGEFFG